MSRVWFAPVSFGLGDLVVSLPPLQALIRAGDDVWLVARAASQAGLAERIDGLAGVIAEAELDRDAVVAAADDRLVDLRDHPLQRDWWWGSAEFEHAFGRWSIDDILARISADFGIAADFSLPVALRSRPRPELGSAVAFVADSDGPAKTWGADRWAAVAAAVRSRGLTPLVVTRNDPSPVHGIDAVCAPTPGDAVDVLTAARAVVGVDTGLTHIAAQQGTPTVTIARRDGVYFRAWPHTRLVSGEPCDDTCRAVDREYAYHDRISLAGFEWRPRPCPVDGRCTTAIPADGVVRALAELL